MDAQAPNKVFAEWAADGGFLPDVAAIRPEYAYGSSRLDFCIETKDRLHLVEVKGVTLEENGNALFPDAPTERGVKHIRELQRAAETGLDAVLFFVVQIKIFTASHPMTQPIPPLEKPCGRRRPTGSGCWPMTAM